MKSNVNTPVIIAILCVVIVLLIGFGWYSMNKEPPLRLDTRNSPMAKNPVAGGRNQGNTRDANADPP